MHQLVVGTIDQELQIVVFGMIIVVLEMSDAYNLVLKFLVD